VRSVAAAATVGIIKPTHKRGTQTMQAAGRSLIRCGFRRFNRPVLTRERVCRQSFGRRSRQEKRGGVGAPNARRQVDNGPGGPRTNEGKKLTTARS
jgi:hypothetical protein